MLLLQCVDLLVGEGVLAEGAVALFPELVALLGQAVGNRHLYGILEEVRLVDGHGLKLFAHERELHGRVLRVLLVVPTEPGGEEREVGLPAEQGGVLRGFAAFWLGGEVVEAGEAR